MPSGNTWANHPSFGGSYYFRDVFQVPVGDLFEGAFWPGLTLVAVYIIYILILSFINKEVAPAIPASELTDSKLKQVMNAFKAIILPIAYFL